MLHRATGYSGSMNIPNQLQASRVEELLIGIMVKAAQTGGCLLESRRQGIPNMIIFEVSTVLETYKSKVLGWKISGAGGGGYLVFVSEQPIEKAIQIRIRRG